MRIIRVSSCDDCPNSRYHFNQYFYCAKNPARKVDNYMDNKTLPGNCPLEEVAGLDYLEGKDVKVIANGQT